MKQYFIVKVVKKCTHKEPEFWETNYRFDDYYLALRKAEELTDKQKTKNTKSCYVSYIVAKESI